MIILVASIYSIQAQQGGNGAPRRSVEERVKMTMDRITDSLKLDAKQQPLTSVALTDYYKAQEKLREGLVPGTRPEKTQMDKLMTDRDEALKKIWSEAQFKKFKEMMASMGQRGPRPPQENK